MPTEPSSTTDLTPPSADGPPIDAATSQYVVRWNRLVSTTNWEKGQIICQWRAALIEAGAAESSYSDEAWSRTVGNLTAQHVGRLRRVYQRFHVVRQQYAGLYWSHFQAAIDWEDAEMWLEGAVQNDWSISQMRTQRATTLGLLEPPTAVADELDEDAPQDTAVSAGDAAGPAEAISGSVEEVRAAGESSAVAEGPEEFPLDDVGPCLDEAPPPLRPLEDLPPLPPDLDEAFEAFKLAIVRHRLAAWQDVRCEDVLAALEALRQLALAQLDDALGLC